MNHIAVTDQFATSPQITVADVETIKSLGYVAIINNRPDAEAPDQEASTEIESAAKQAGLQYFHLPITSGALPMEAIDATKELLAKINGPTFAFCRSGTRSITLWALAQKGKMEAGDIIRAVADAGYDLPFLEGYL